jgi:hypothetical protein
LRVKLANVGLLNKRITSKVPERSVDIDPMFYYKGSDAGFYPLSIDEAKKLYISKR